MIAIFGGRKKCLVTYSYMPHLYDANYTSAYMAPRLGLWVNKVIISLDPVRGNSTENIWPGT